MKIFLLAFFTLCSTNLVAQKIKSENVVVVTLDGYRWQELFTGADSLLTFRKSSKYNTDYVKQRFWASTPEERRLKLMPFFWTELKSKGLISGNRNYGNDVNNANRYWFSYPGYNEIVTGYPDTGVNSNDKIPNPNENVFEYLQKKPGFRGKAAVFASWDVFSSIFNEKRSGVFVNDGFRDVPGAVTGRQKLFNTMQHEMPDLFHGPSERLDLATYYMGLEYMKVNKPKLMYFGFGDTDEFAHAGQYDYYLDAAYKTDQWIGEIWKYIQSDPYYAGKTTMIITTDHGRGAAGNGEWTSHGEKIKGAGQIWMAAIGPSIIAVGEDKKPGQLQQGQIAATVAGLLGFKFLPSHPVLPPIKFAEK